VVSIDGYPFEAVDLWNGALNETTAGLHYEPLTYQPNRPGPTWQPFAPWLCN
jgi:hypothetical protein